MSIDSGKIKQLDKVCNLTMTSKAYNSGNIQLVNKFVFLLVCGRKVVEKIGSPAVRLVDVKVRDKEDNFQQQ